MVSPISSLTSTSAADPSGQAAAATSARQGQQMFLQLLVAQLQNQDPMNPADGMTFVSQLAQFSQVETLLGIRSDLNSFLTKETSTTAPSAPAKPGA